MIACVKNNNHNNSNDNDDNDNASNNHNKSLLLRTRKKGDQRYCLKLNKPILKQMIMISQPSSSPCHTNNVLSSLKKCYMNERNSTTLDLKTKIKMW